MKMFVANCSQQVQDFMYRVPNNAGMRVQKIEIGGQTPISGDLTEKDIEYIVGQHARYGMVRVDEIDRTKPFMGLCWDDKPIKVDHIRRAVEHNTGVLVERGKQIMAEAAIATSENIEGNNPDLKLRNLEMAVTEDKTDNPELNTGVSVSRNNPPPKGGKQTKK